MAEGAWPTDDDFFEAVEQHVTPAMAAHRYVVCSVGEGTASDAGSTLTRVPAWRAHRLFLGLPPLRRTRLVRHLAVGYEGDSGNELWIGYFPERHGLDLGWWRDLLRGGADFDVSEIEAVDRAELHRRLRLVGEAVSAASTLEDDPEDGRPR